MAVRAQFSRPSPRSLVEKTIMDLMVQSCHQAAQTKPRRPNELGCGLAEDEKTSCIEVVPALLNQQGKSMRSFTVEGQDEQT